ncbi:MAG TPA: ankyrin repeat domain-containing protein, partial [Ktedonobacterales bacterium]|nr:ankyrin repeat domain-containing protein [Ktedonobacterales bacterium]
LNPAGLGAGAATAPKPRLERFAQLVPQLGPGMRAIHEGDLDRLRALLSGGLRPNPTKPQPITLLALAVSWGRAEAVDLLLEAGADPNLTKPHGVILATWATGDCDLPILTSLLRHGADANAVGLAEHTPLVQAVRVRCYGAIGLLLDHGAALETRDPDGLTVLAFAARMGDDRAVALLLERGAQLDAKNQVGFTPLALAAHGGHGAVVERLLAAGANKEAANTNGTTALGLAASAGQVGSVGQLLAAGARLEGNPELFTSPLGLAASRGQVAAARLLLDAGASPDGPAHSMWTPLELAAHHGQVQTLRLLIGAGANVNHRDPKGRTALMWASWRQFRRCYEILIAAGADPHLVAHGPDEPRSAPPVPLLQRSWPRVPSPSRLQRWIASLMLMTMRRRIVKGIPVAVGVDKAQQSVAFQAVEGALGLIEKYDPRELRRMRESFTRIVVAEAGVDRAAYSAPLRWCVLKWEPKPKPVQLAARIAALVVHEATHARLLRAGFGYREEERVRVERACSRAAEVFARRLPAGGHAIADMKTHLAVISPRALSDAAQRGRYLKILKDSGAPRWMIRSFEWWRRRRERGGQGGPPRPP